MKWVCVVIMWSLKTRLEKLYSYSYSNLKLPIIWERVPWSPLSFLSYFFVKKYLLVGASSMLWTGQWISQSVSQWVRYVCMSRQSDWIYYTQPIKFLVVKVNGTCMWEDSIPTQFRTAIFILLRKRRRYLFSTHFLWVMLRILVMDKMSLEVWDSSWACCMQM